MTLLGLKLGRRLVAAVALRDERVVFHDTRYVRAGPALDAALRRYFDRLLTQLTPTRVFFYAPTTTQTTTAVVVAVLTDVAAARGIPVHGLPRADILNASGWPPARTRRELREGLAELWPPLADGKVARQTALAEAAAAAFVGEVLTPP